MKLRNFKRILSLFLSILMMFSMLPIQTIVSAAEDACVSTENCTGTYSNGFCSVCDGYQPATDSDGDGYYEIGNAGQLYWWATNKSNSSAILVADIVVNKNVLADDGNLNGDASTFRAWIDLEVESITFEGNKHTISGLYASGYGTGFFTEANGSVKIYNLGIIDSYFYNTGYATGALVGYVTGNGNEITNCYSTATVAGDTYLLGGLLGAKNRYPKIKNCYYAGYRPAGACFMSEYADDDYYSNNYYLTSSENTSLSTLTGKTAEQFASGEVAYLLNGSSSEDTVAYKQTLGSDAYPNFTGEIVYCGYENCLSTEKTYANTALYDEIPTHIYTADCDEICNICETIRETSVAHTFDNACDAECNVCDSTRTVGDHVYSYDCDIDCNECGYVRTDATAHTYTADCDSNCNICGDERETEAEHSYTADCDADCNNCEYVREVEAEHVYTHDCDETCENCEYEREAEVEHTYTADCDADCNVCGYVREDVVAHTYTDECDANCNNCEYVRDAEAEHTYTADCDTTCNNCEYVREAEAEHTYTADCDENCNNCEYVREAEVEHAYTHDCDETCENCEYEREAEVEHTYTADCDDSCNVCGYVREDVVDHTYTGPCDPSCSECGYIRLDVVAHEFTYECSTACNNCDYTRVVTCVYENGFCKYCDSYEEATLNEDGYYEIDNAGKLYWFAQQVNNGETAINARLTDNIVVNENVLNGTDVNDGDFRDWTPMGLSDAYFTGEFDGACHTISGLYCSVGYKDDDATLYAGLFAWSDGTIKNLGIEDSYFAALFASSFVAGYSYPVVTNCYSTAVVEGTNAGGIAYQGEISNCYFAGKCKHDLEQTGGISCHHCAPTNCYYLEGSASWESADGMEEGTATPAEQFASGEVAYLLNEGVTDGTQVWYQNIDNGETADALPSFTGGTVYYTELFPYPAYTNENYHIVIDSDTYFPACEYTGTSIVEALKSVGYGYSYADREAIAIANGMTNYTGTADQNATLLSKLKAGTLKRPGQIERICDSEGEPLLGWVTVGGVSYYFELPGIIKTGWTVIDETGVRCYFDENGQYVTNSWMADGTNWRYLGEDGAVVTNSLIETDGETYYVGDDGYRISGWKNADGAWYYFDADSEYKATKQSVNIGEDFFGSMYTKTVGTTDMAVSICYDDTTDYYGETSIRTFANSYDQNWRFQLQEDGSYKIISMVDYNCLDAKNGEAYYGVDVSTRADDGGVQQRWIFLEYEEGVYYIVPVCVIDEADDMYCALDVNYAETAENTRVSLSKFNGDPNQQFYIVEHTEESEHLYDDNGFCFCDDYQPAELVDGYYEIDNAGKLYWFAEQTNNGELAINAKLTDDIVVNENVLDENGDLNGDGSDLRKWEPIDNNYELYDNSYFEGEIDGQNHTISGLYSSRSFESCLIVFNNGKISNLGIIDSYFTGVGGAICYSNESNGEITNCFNESTLVGSFVEAHGVGGICGSNSGTITDCYNTGKIYSTKNKCGYYGGICGANWGGTITNCYNTGAVTDCNFSNAYYGGICGFSSGGTIKDCYNTGTITAYSCAGGICGFSEYENIIENCYNVGVVTGKVAYYGVSNLQLDSTTINCYYLADSETDEFDGTTAMTADQFASGEVAYLLNSGVTDGTQTWYQTCGEGYPDYSGDTVYQVEHYYCNVENGFYYEYSNTNEAVYDEHVYVADCAELCSVCGLTRETEVDHTYDNACDTNCNVCDEVREVPDHVYDNACDTDCNECGDVREVPDHVYDNACDADCNECGVVREVPDHVYDNACDANCNVCGDVREVPDHVYDNACDTNCNVCDEVREVPDHIYENGFCTVCDAYEPAELVDDYYEIDNAGKLYWFAEKVMEDSTINAKLTDNIVVNENVIDENGDLIGDGSGLRNWTPIGLSEDGTGIEYSGVFDGQNHTISGLYGGISAESYIDDDTTITMMMSGLFCRNDNTIKNVGIVGSFLGETDDEIIGITGGISYDNRGTIENCYNASTVGGDAVGGICFSNNGSISNCYNEGKVVATINPAFTGNFAFVGGIASQINGGTNIINCYNTGDIIGTVNAGGIVGCGLDNYNIENCYNTGSVTAENKAGGIIGYAYVDYYSSYITDCYNTGVVTATAEYSYAGGISGYISTDDITISNCYNVGEVTGAGYVDQICAQDNTGVEDDDEIQIASLSTDTATGPIYNCYYLADCEYVGDGDVLPKTAEQFASGEVAYLLNNGVTDGTQAWYQTCGEGYPAFSGETVYAYNVYTTCDKSDVPTQAYANEATEDVVPEHTYDNACDTDCNECGDVREVPDHVYDNACDTNCNECDQVREVPDHVYDNACDTDCNECGNIREVPDHIYDNGFCTVCDAYEEASLNADGYYEIGNAGQLYWFVEFVNNVDNSVNAKLIDNIDDNGRLFDIDGGLMGREFREWVKISEFNGVFDGQGHTIRSLYSSKGENAFVKKLNSSGVLKNFGIIDSFFSTASSRIAFICNDNYGTIVDCFASGGILDSTTASYTGGLCNENRGTIKNCYNECTIYCGSYGAGICGYNNGGVIENCYNAGEIQSTAVYAAGICGFNRGGKINNCYNYGTVSSGNPSSICSVVNDITETIYDEENIAPDGLPMEGETIIVSAGVVSNCYYLNTEASDSKATAKTADQFASGEVTYLLNEGVTDGTQAWYQTCGEGYPAFSGETVYAYNVYTTCDKSDVPTQAYANEATEDVVPEHNYVDHICTGCGDCNLQLGDVNGDGEVSISDATEIQKHLAHITTLSEASQLVADVNDDGKISVRDVTYIQMLVARYIEEFPVNQ